MDTVTIIAEKRSEAGKKVSSGLRRDGKVPCVMYGKNASEKLAVSGKQLFKALSGSGGTRVILDVDIDGAAKKTAILKELQYHPLTDSLIHADFMEIDTLSLLKTKLPVVLKGDPVGVKLRSGKLKQHLNEMIVEALPKDLPTAIVVDISGLDVNARLTVSDINLPAGVNKLDRADSAVVSIAPPKRMPESKAEGAENGAKAGK